MTVSSVLDSSLFKAPPTAQIYTLSLHDALPISWRGGRGVRHRAGSARAGPHSSLHAADWHGRARACSDECRSEEHTSELQSRLHLVCRLLLEKKKKTIYKLTTVIKKIYHTYTLH